MTASLRIGRHGNQVRKKARESGETLTVRLLDRRQLTVPIVRSRRRTLALHVKAGGVEMRAPLRCSVALMSKFLDSKRAWLSRALEQMSGMPPRKEGLADGDRVFLLGKELVISVRRGEKQGVLRRASKLDVTVSASVSGLDLQRGVASLVEDWYRQLAVKHILPRVKELARQMGVRPQSVRIGRARSTWGRCVQGGHVHFTWHLLKTPPRIIDSVIIHELCHLEEMNHSHRFWKLVARHDPGHLESRAWLLANTSRLLE